MQDDDQPPRRTGWEKLRRRKVVQWSVVYVGVAWGLLQALEFAVQAFDGSEAITRGAAVAAVFGLALAITLAWYHGDRGQQRVTRTEFAFIALIALVGASATWYVSRTFDARPPVAATSSAQTVSRAADRRRLAVLPFVNLGADPTNAAFVGGVHDTLITQIAKVPGLSVIARSSVLQYEGKSPTARAIAEALQVGSVLEGSVQREGSRLRVQARLIDAASEANLWTETFDRTADDLFAIQSEIALAIVGQLRLRLTVDETDQLSAALTSNPRAYEHYVLGRSFLAQDQDDAAIREFTAAVTLDPNFAAAFAQRSMTRTWRAWNTRDHDNWQESGKADADRALAIDPTLPMGHHARAVYLYRGKADMAGAAAEFEQAIAGLPNDAAVHLDFAFLRRWQGQYDEAAALFVRAAELDPRSWAPLQAAMLLTALGRHDQAQLVVRAAQAAAPDDALAVTLPVVLALMYDCDLAEAERVNTAAAVRFPDHPAPFAGRWWLAWLSGDAASAVAALDEFTARFSEPGPYLQTWEIGHTQLAAGRVDEGRKTVRDELEATRATLDQQNLSDEVVAQTYARIAIYQALLGQRAEAVESAERSRRALPPTGAAWSRTGLLFEHAIALAQAGEKDAAIERLREMLARPAEFGASGLWCHPLLRPLRADPRFRELIAAHGGNVAIDPHDRSTWP
jgi:TolB-like protein